VIANGAAGAGNLQLIQDAATHSTNDVVIPGAADGAVHAVAIVYDGTQHLAYVDGVLVNTVTQPAQRISAPGPFRVGSYTGAASANMILDDFRFYSRALSEAEVIQLSVCSVIFGIFPSE
jgi:hypothetical protein